jgi:hypothetical protein
MCYQLVQQKSKACFSCCSCDTGILEFHDSTSSTGFLYSSKVMVDSTGVKYRRKYWRKYWRKVLEESTGIKYRHDDCCVLATYHAPELFNPIFRRVPVRAISAYLMLRITCVAQAGAKFWFGTSTMLIALLVASPRDYDIRFPPPLFAYVACTLALSEE